MIRLLLADDHAVVRAGLTQMLAGVPDIEVIGAVSDGGAALEAARIDPPDVVLMDLQMPGVDGIEGTRRIKREMPDVAVVVLTTFSDSQLVLEAIDAGANGYMLKDAEPDELLRAIRVAAKGESPISPKAAQTLLLARTQRRGPVLTERERAVLMLVADGLTNHEIAARLYVSEKTVKAHLTSVYQRLDVDGRTQAAEWARRNLVPESA